jgi:hypothetical protein
MKSPWGRHARFPPIRWVSVTAFGDRDLRLKAGEGIRTLDVQLAEVRPSKTLKAPKAPLFRVGASKVRFLDWAL